MTTLQTTTSEVINLLQPEKVLVHSSNYLQCVIEGKFREFQISYKDKCWYEFKTTGNSYEPVEKLIKTL
jgi:hypothetical protein